MHSLLRGCILGPALIFGRIGTRPVPWAAFNLLFEHNSRPRENGQRKKTRGGEFKKSVVDFRDTDRILRYDDTVYSKLFTTLLYMTFLDIVFATPLNIFSV